MADWLAIAVQDVNGNPVPGAELKLKGLPSVDPDATLTGVAWSGGMGQAPLTIFNLEPFEKIVISFEATDYFSQTMTLMRDRTAGTIEVNARSPQWGLFATETIMAPRLTLVAGRVIQSPVGQLVIPTRDQAPPVVTDPGGIIVDGSNRLVGLYTGAERGFQFVPGADMLGNADADDWGRFAFKKADVEPLQPDRGSRFLFVEYGDPPPAKAAQRQLVAVWVLNRAAQRSDGKADVHVFFGPSTGIEDFAPPNVFPYKVKRISRKPSPSSARRAEPVQPYSDFAYRYLSTGSKGGPGTPPGREFGFAYQSLATDRSHILIMPLNAYGFWGPLCCRAGLLRMVREVVAFVSDLEFRGVKARSLAMAGAQQLLNRMAVSGYSAGAVEAARLFRTATIAELSAAYRAVKGDKVSAGYAKRLDQLKPALWQSPAQEIERRWQEFYAIDGDFKKLTGRAFPDEAARWFAADEERMLRVYATPWTARDPAALLQSSLREVFKGVAPNEAKRAKDASYSARQWQRDDGRATLAWFSANYMKFTGVERMPSGVDEHHTIPRVVVSHAVKQSRFVPM